MVPEKDPEDGPGPEDADPRDVEEELRRSESRLLQAQRVAKVGSWEWDIPTDTISWSDELFRRYGYEPGEFHPSYDDFLERIHPDDRELVDGEVQKAYQDGDSFEFDHRLVRPDGEVRWLHAVGEVVRDGDGQAVRMVGTAQDITTTKTAERRFELLLESAPDAMIITDDQGVIVLVNQRAEQLFGYDREEMLGHRIEMLVPQGKRTAHKGHRARYAQDPKPRPMGQDQDLTARRKDGSEVPVEISLSPMRTDEGLLVTAAVRDVSARREAEKADLVAQRRLAEIERLREKDTLKTNLLNTAAHELNTPLTPIRLQLHLLNSGTFGELSDKLRRAIAIVDRNAERLGAIITDFLDVARLESGRMAIEPQPVDLESGVQDVVESFREPAEKVGVRLKVKVPSGLAVQADPHRLGQVLYNLVSNAIKFTPEGGTVTLEASVVGKEAKVSVTDTGIGLDAEQIERLFQPFTQVHDMDKVAAGGTGLGLFISKGIVEAHGGEMEVGSPGPGKGATFAFTVPTTDEKPPSDSAVPERMKERRRRSVQGPKDLLAERLRELI